MHLANGAAFGAAYADVAAAAAAAVLGARPRRRDGRAPRLVAAACSSATASTPPATSCRPCSGNARAFAQATWRHFLFGVVLGEVERRLNAPEDEEVPPYEHVVSTNGHGNIEHVYAGSSSDDDDDQ